MAVYISQPMIAALPGPPLTVVTDAVGNLFLPDDTTYSSPLTVELLDGTSIVNVTSNDNGIIPALRLPAPVVVWKSGAYTIPVSTVQGAVEGAEAAALAAEAARDAAAASQAAAELAQAATPQQINAHLGGPAAGLLGTDGKVMADRIPAGSGGGGSAVVSDATATTKGILRLTGDLGGSASSPTVPALADVLTRLSALENSGPSTTLSVAVSGNSITLSWAGVTAATGYLVGRDGVDLYGTQGVTEQVSAATLSRTFADLEYGTEYTFTVQPLPNGRMTAIKATTLAPPTTGTDTTVSVVGGDGVATLSWTAVTGATGYLVGRDGVDTSGSGAYQTTDPASATSRVFLALVNGTTYTLFCEPQGTGKPAYPAVGHGRKTITVTPTAAPPDPTQTTVKVTGITNTSLTLSWTAVTGATGYLVGRDGVDSNGSGAYQTTVGSGTLSLTFSYLVPGNGYTLFCTPQPGGQRKEITTATTVDPIDPGTPPAGSGTVWLSGSCGGNDNAAARNGFGTWRGEPQTYIRLWTDDQLSNMLAVGYYMQEKGFSAWTGGTLDLAIGGPNAHGTGTTWASAATGSMDSIWRQQCQAIHANWGNLKCVHLSMAHEINGNWFPWSVNLGNLSYYKQAWARYVNIVNQELKAKGRNVKICLNYAAGQPNVEAIYPGTGQVDLIGFDSYDMWMPTPTKNIRTQAEWDAFKVANAGDGSPWGHEAFANWAASKGKPFTIPEWAISASAQFEYDNPFYVQKVYDWLKTRAPADPDNPAPGKCAGEAYFNTWNQCQIWPTLSKPLTGAKYQSLKWGSTV